MADNQFWESLVQGVREGFQEAQKIIQDAQQKAAESDPESVEGLQVQVAAFKKLYLNACRDRDHADAMARDYAARLGRCYDAFNLLNQALYEK